MNKEQAREFIKRGDLKGLIRNEKDPVKKRELIEAETEVIVRDTKDSCKRIIENMREDRDPERVISGIHQIDSQQLGYRKTDFAILAAGESEGKTSFAIGRCVEMAKKGVRVGVVSAEMSADDIYDQMACYIAGVDTERLDTNNLIDDERKKIIEALEKLYEAPIYIIDEIDKWTRTKLAVWKLKTIYNVDFIMIDYLQMIEADEKMSEYDETRLVSRGLKKLTKELEVPILALACITKDGKDAERPRSYHIRGNGKVANDADIIFMMKTLSWAVDGDENKRVVRFFMDKNRKGKKRDFTLLFDCPTRRFYQDGYYE